MKKVFAVVENKKSIVQVFLKRINAIGWIKNYENQIPKQASRSYFGRYKVEVFYLRRENS